MAPFINSKTEKPYLLDDEIRGVETSGGRGCYYPGAPSILWVGQGWIPLLCCGTSPLFSHAAAIFIPTNTGGSPPSSFFIPLFSTVHFLTMDFDLIVYLVFLNWQFVCRLESWHNMQNGRSHLEVKWRHSLYILISEFMAKSYSLKNSNHLDNNKISSRYVLACYSSRFHSTLTLSWCLL